MKETIFFSGWRWGILSLSSADHVKGQCRLVDGFEGICNSWLSIIWDVQWQVQCSFDVVTAGGSCLICWILMDPIVINGDFELDSCSECLCYRKIILILLISESRGVICNKNQIDTTISWGQYFSPLILDESWSHWYHSDPGHPRILEI